MNAEALCPDNELVGAGGKLSQLEAAVAVRSGRGDFVAVCGEGYSGLGKRITSRIADAASKTEYVRHLDSWRSCHMCRQMCRQEQDKKENNPGQPSRC
jgi:hypothetical protein